VSLKIDVQVKTKANPEKVEKIDSTHYVVRVNAPPVDGLANQRIIELLSKYFKIPKSKIELVSGFKSKKKVFILDIIPIE
jgi:uncharacterized protein